MLSFNITACIDPPEKGYSLDLTQPNTKEIKSDPDRCPEILLVLDPALILLIQLPPEILLQPMPLTEMSNQQCFCLHLPTYLHSLS